jgi:peptidoglycan-associated lipoprotein
MIPLTRRLMVFAFLGLGGCASKQPPPPVAPSGSTQQDQTRHQDKPGDNPSQSQIAISDEIRRACGLPDEDAYFAFDSTKVQQRDREILGKVARCFVSGPLAGKQMKLVGHADPRGEEEYNMVLGGRRADNVKAFIVSEGLPSPRVSSTSRGELDASGTDEASWSKDRRVDVLVGG